MTMRESQIQYWNDPNVAADVRAGTTGVSDFAQRIAEELTRPSRVVELGCGAGDDAAFFAEQDHEVIAIDVSQPLIDLAAQRFANMSNLAFRQSDITDRLGIAGDSTDVAYSRLALHYFDDHTTIGVFSEVFWILRPGGRFAFMVKSDKDPLYGKGERIEDDMFEYRGEVRHFFSRTYAEDLLEQAGFINAVVNEGVERHYGEPSAYLIAIASKT